jgi:3-oxoacyl-[acyl-carrier protein] reductase
MVYMATKLPMGHCGTIEEAVALFAWIVPRECGFSTGFVFDLSGGRATYWES